MPHSIAYKNRKSAANVAWDIWGREESGTSIHSLTDFCILVPPNLLISLMTLLKSDICWL